MRFKREVEFSVDEDGAVWLYLNCKEGLSRPVALNLSNCFTPDGVIGRNFDSWVKENVTHYTQLQLEKIRDDPQLPESVRKQAEFYLSQVL